MTLKYFRRRWPATAHNALSIEPSKDLHIQKISYAGEPGALVPYTNKRIEEAWGVKVYDHAGATESGIWGFECEFQPGELHVNEAMFLAKVEDSDTGKPITEPGIRGKLVITLLDRIAQPCIRFDSKDLVEISSNVCECGRTFMMFQGGVIGRVDDITKVKGVLLSPSAIEDVVRSFSELSDEYEVVVEKRDDADHILLKVELAPGISDDRKPEVEAALRTQLRLKTNLGYALEFHAHGSLYRYEVKARRFKDLRK